MSNKKSITKDDATLNFRISKELKDIIVSEAEKENLKSSKYLRNLLEAIHNGSYCYEKEVKTERAAFIFSMEFLQLMVWIYKKRENTELEIEKYELNIYIDTLKKVANFLPAYLVEEFDKVLQDVLLLKLDNSYISKTKFDFSKSIYPHKKFNYELVEKFILNQEALEEFIENGEDSGYDIILNGGIEI